MASARLISAFALVGMVACSAPAWAELPPRYPTWGDFAAVVEQSSIPRVLGVVDRIERVSPGKFVVSAGTCSVEVSVTRESSTDAQGRPLAGPSHVAHVAVGAKVCKQ